MLWATPTSQRSAPLPALTVNSPVIGSKPTWTVCSKLVGYDILGFESLCDGLDPLILFFSVFFLRSRSSGSVSDVLNRWEVQSKIPCNSGLACLYSPFGRGLMSTGGVESPRSLPPRLLVRRTGGAGGLSSSLDIAVGCCVTGSRQVRVFGYTLCSALAAEQFCC